MAQGHKLCGGAAPRRVRGEGAPCGLAVAGCGEHKTLEGQLIEWSDNVSDAARKAVDDPVRATEAGRIAEVIGAELKLFFDEIGLSRVRFQRLSEDYDAERRDFEALAHQGRRARRARAEEVIRLTMEMRKQMTPEEWSRFVEIRKGITALDERHDSTQEDYRAQYEHLNRVWAELDKQLLGARFRLKQVLTREEWTAVFAQAQFNS